MTLISVAMVSIGSVLFLSAMVRLGWRIVKARRVELDAWEVRRPWTVHRPSGAVPLGRRLNYDEALEKARKLGHVTFVDLEHGFIFTDTHLGGSNESVED